MKAVYRYSIAFAATVAAICLLIVLSALSREDRRQLTCSGLQVDILDSTRLSFVSRADVKRYVEKDYGVYMGQKLDSVNLRKIENILDGRSAILKSEAYVTGDGMLHVLITQREPVVRFQKGDTGYYADETGFIFPLQTNYTSRVPIIDGNIPLDVSAGFKGSPSDAKEKSWLEGIIGMVRFIGNSKTWSESIVQITVDERGDLVMIPRKGQEKFIFGKPDNYKAKFSRMEDYYRYILPAKPDMNYRTVNVKYDGQIICRK